MILLTLDDVSVSPVNVTKYQRISRNNIQDVSGAGFGCLKIKELSSEL